MFGKPKVLIKSALSSLQIRVIDPATPREIALINELRRNCGQLPSRDVKGPSDAENTWNKVLNHFRYLIATKDPRRFLTWDHLQTMVVGNADYVEQELAYLKQSEDWSARWSPSIEESNVGQPRPYPDYPQSSGNLIHHGYHLCRFEEVAGKLIDSFDMVVEFGGGYGSMCRLFHGLGFKGRYVIFDFPEFSYLQQFFLRSLDLPVQSIESFREPRQGIVTVSDIALLEEVVSAHRENGQSLFVATWSLSETSIEFRQRILRLVSLFDAFLFAYQDKFGEVDNDAFFTDWKSAKPEIRWHQWPIQHLPGNYYIMGRKN